MMPLLNLFQVPSFIEQASHKLSPHALRFSKNCTRKYSTFIIVQLQINPLNVFEISHVLFI